MADPERIEAIARKLCELRGVDPELSVMVENGLAYAFAAQWRLVAREVEARFAADRARSEQDEAIAYVDGAAATNDNASPPT